MKEFPSKTNEKEYQRMEFLITSEEDYISCINDIKQLGGFIKSEPPSEKIAWFNLIAFVPIYDSMDLYFRNEARREKYLSKLLAERQNGIKINSEYLKLLLADVLKRSKTGTNFYIGLATYSNYYNSYAGPYLLAIVNGQLKNVVIEEDHFSASFLLPNLFAGGYSFKPGEIYLDEILFIRTDSDTLYDRLASTKELETNKSSPQLL